MLTVDCLKWSIALRVEDHQDRYNLAQIWRTLVPLALHTFSQKHLVPCWLELLARNHR